MRYRSNPRNGDRLSLLGFGCMRLPGEKEARRLVARAVELGVNYFDTAYAYPGNEALLGRILSQGLRERVMVATKLPPFLIKRREDFDRILDKQLSRLQTDRIDYYLMHMLPDAAAWERLERLGAPEFLSRRKAAGDVGAVGFSFHGGLPAFTELLDVYPWEFCLLQYNYLDEFRQAGRPGVALATAKGVPVMVMEPVRGGMLARLPKPAMAVWEGAPEKRSPAEWALRWVMKQQEILTVLSGMNTMDMLEENVRAACRAEASALPPAELALYGRVRDILTRNTRVACTGCNYCMPCPQGVDIPLCFSCFNDAALERGVRPWIRYILRATGHQASLCGRCGLCETRCPQGIPIREALARTARTMERFPYKPARFITNRIMRR